MHINKWFLILGFFFFLSTSLVLISTSSYGLGTTPDSISYISIAKNFSSGAGYVRYDGDPSAYWPPLVPLLLSLSDNPLIFFRIINAFAFGVICILSGLLVLRYINSFISRIIGFLLLLLSSPLFNISTYGWSEAVFIMFMLITVSSLLLHFNNHKIQWLFVACISSSLAGLTRYIGIVVIASSIIFIFINSEKTLRNKIFDCFLFGSFAIFPIAAWMGRNLLITGTWLGPRFGSAFSLRENCYFAFNTILSWFFPSTIYQHSLLRLIPIIILLVLVAFIFAKYRENFYSWFSSSQSFMVFPILYIVFLLYSSSTTAFDRIDNRLLAPIYPFVIIFLLAIVEKFNNIIRSKFVGYASVLVAIIIIWTPTNYIIKNASCLYQGTCNGYSSAEWKNSETISYIKSHSEIFSNAVYSNAPIAIYLYTGFIVRQSPDILEENSNQPRKTMNDTSWPENKSYLIWFDNFHRSFLFSKEELIANCELISNFVLLDGSVTSLSKLIK